jgi:ornithine cyclodeaminase/alanine dehydrogenase-like protein (mu-crystallin family)
VSGRKPGRTSADEITLFKFNGMAIEDVACAGKAYQKAVEKGVGVEFSF